MKILAQPKGTVYAVVSAATGSDADLYDISVVNAKGKVCMTISGYRTIELPDTVSEVQVAPMKALK